MDAVIVALVALFRTALAADGAPVYDGPLPTEEDAASLVMVGTSGDENDDAASEVSPDESAFAEFDDAPGEVDCLTYARNGDGDMAAARLRATQLRDLCRTAINADRSLGGVLKAGGRARVVRTTLRPAQSSSGAEVRLTFTVGYTQTLT